MVVFRLSILCTLAVCVPLGAVAQTPETAQFSDAAEVLQTAIQDGAFPGCAIAVGTSNSQLWSQGFGHFVYENKVARQLGFAANPEVTSSTVYDLASLTKVIGTTSVMMCLVRDGRLKPKDRISDLIPAFADPDDDRRDTVTVEHLLIHASGLPSWQPFYKRCSGLPSVIRAVVQTPLESNPGAKYRYSDVGFMLLGDLCGRVGEQTLPELEKKLVFTPLDMQNTFRQPALKDRHRIPPTEQEPETERFIHGFVHDENARAAGGITGHAGLFSTADDLSKLAMELLLAYRGQGKLFSEQLTKQFVTRNDSVPRSSRALGWDTPSGRSSGGERISQNSVGHTGFTGTSIWIDFERDLYLILLSNRVHPTRNNRKISEVRRQFADAVLSSFDRKD